MSRRHLLLTAAIAAVLVLVLALGLALRPGDDAAGPGGMAAVPGASLPAGDGGEAAMSAAAREQARISALADRLRALRRQPGNLPGLLESLRADCDSEAACRTLIDAALAEIGDPAFAAMLGRLLDRLPAYEAAMQSTVMSMQTPPRERYARIDALRQQILGVAETEFAFGQERAFAEFQFGYGELLARADGLSPAQRLAELERLRKEAWGSHAAALSAVEGRDGAYARELELLLAGVSNAAERERLTAQLRARHYSAEEAAQLAARDRDLASQQQQVAAYQQELAALQQAMEAERASLPASQWQALYEARMTALRLKHFP